jgi:molybdate transport system ATP-binding protein
MSFDVAIRRRIGGRDFAFDFRTGDGLTAVFGASGSGKTSLMYMIAGVTRPDSGRIAVAGRTLYDGAADISLPIEGRHSGYIFQDGRLFPHLTVKANLLYGARLGRDRPALMGFDETVEFLGIGTLLDRRPRTLSGGEAQRVAIGRALLAAPAFLLMDEPLYGLDMARKLEIIAVIRRLRDAVGLPIMFVSHDLDEVERLADHLVLLDGGQVRASGPAVRVMTDLAHPLARANDAAVVLPADPVDYDPAYDLTRCRIGDATVQIPGRWREGPLSVRIRALDVSLSLDPYPRTSVLNSLPATIVDAQPNDAHAMGVSLKLTEGGPDALILSTLTRKSWDRLGLAIGDSVTANIKAMALLEKRSGT